MKKEYPVYEVGEKVHILPNLFCLKGKTRFGKITEITELGSHYVIPEGAPNMEIGLYVHEIKKVKVI